MIESSLLAGAARSSPELVWARLQVGSSDSVAIIVEVEVEVVEVEVEVEFVGVEVEVGKLR